MDISAIGAFGGWVALNVLAVDAIRRSMDSLWDPDGRVAEAVLGCGTLVLPGAALMVEMLLRFLLGSKLALERPFELVALLPALLAMPLGAVVIPWSLVVWRPWSAPWRLQMVRLASVLAWAASSSIAMLCAASV